MTAFLAEVNSAVQFLPTSVVTLIADFDTVNDRVILAAVAGGHVLIAAWVAEPVVAVLVAVVLLAVQGLFTLPAADEGLLFVGAVSFHFGLAAPAGNFDALFSAGATSSSVAEVGTRVLAVEASLSFAVAAAGVGSDA